MKKVKTKATGKLTPKGNPSLQREAKVDDPIYTRGYVIGRTTARKTNTKK